MRRMTYQVGITVRRVGENCDVPQLPTLLAWERPVWTRFAVVVESIALHAAVIPVSVATARSEDCLSWHRRQIRGSENRSYGGYWNQPSSERANHVSWHPPTGPPREPE